jgi:hypothetical protein
LGDTQAAEAKSTMCEKASGSNCIVLCEDFSRAHNQQIENKFRIKLMPENDVLIFYARLRKHKKLIPASSINERE